MALLAVALAGLPCYQLRRQLHNPDDSQTPSCTWPAWLVDLLPRPAGKFPTWLAPVQVDVLPVSEKSRAYANEVAAKLDAAGIRVKVDNRDEKIGYKIREARGIDRVPYMLILGEKEAEAGNISVRDRSNETVPSTVDEFIAKVTEEIRTRA